MNFLHKNVLLCTGHHVAVDFVIIGFPFLIIVIGSCLSWAAEKQYRRLALQANIQFQGWDFTPSL